MISMSVDISREGWAASPKKALARATKNALLVGGMHWHETFLPRHFKAGAARRYGYQPRDIYYQRRKKKLKGHNIDLVWSGGMRDRFLSTAEFRNSQNKVTVKLPESQVASLAGRARRRKTRSGTTFSVYPDVHKEITTTTPKEGDVLASIVGQAAAKELNTGRRARRR